MKQIAQLLIAIALVGPAYAQTSFLQKIKDTFTPSSQKAAKPSPSQAPGKNGSVAAVPAKPAASSAATSKPGPSTPKGSNSSAPASAKVATSTAAKPAVTSANVKQSKAVATKISVLPVAPQPKQGAQKSGPFTAPRKIKAAKAQSTPKQVPKQEAAKSPAPATEAAAPAPEAKEKKMITAEGRRDPFLSPVVSSPNGPGCSTGKRCLAIDQIVVRGVVKSDTGMIAVVVNAMNKAYFLKENDPVFNGYVMKITGDSVVFKETYQDKLGKDLTREVVKKLTTPAV